MSSTASRPPWAAWLYTHNPFYAISVVLMLYGVRAGYGELEIGSINCWIMLGVLAAYTLVLAGIAVAIVRWGKVWDDARSLFLLLLLLFLAISISADDLFVKSEALVAGAALLVCGFLGSAVLSEAVLRGARIRLGWGYRGPYYLMLGLFYAAPWWCSPALHPRSPAALEWTIFLFPAVAAGLFLLLLPVVRRGAAAVAGNGTPWPWPWFPWTMFGLIAAAVALRSFVLCLTFGPVGPIWRGSGRSVADINFDTIFGLYFLVPLAFALLWLALEGAVTSGNRPAQRRVLALAPLLLVLGLPYGGNGVFQAFLDRFVDQVASPLWIALALLASLYGRAWAARVPLAGTACVATLLLFTVVGPHTLGPRTLTTPEPWPLFVAGALGVVHGVRQRVSPYCLAGAALLVSGMWLTLPQTLAADFRTTLCYHALWAAIIAIGLAFEDRPAATLRIIGALQMPLAALVVLASAPAAAIPLAWRLLYVAALGILAVWIAVRWRQPWYLYASLSLAGLAAFGAAFLGYRQAVSSIGRPAMAAITWSVASLLIAFLISARKASWFAPGWGDWRRLATHRGPAGESTSRPAGPPEQLPDESPRDG